LINPDREKPLLAPLALDYLASALRHAGYEPELLDLAFESDWYAATSQAVSKRDILAVVIMIRHLDDGLYNSQTFFLPKSRTLIEYLRSKTRAPIGVIGGAYSLVSEAILRFCKADFGIANDPESALPLFLNAVENGARYEGIPNIGWLEGRMFHNNPVVPADPSGEWLAERSFIDNVRYFSESGVTRFETKRGCNHHEVYSTDPVTRGDVVRLRSAEHVAQEVELLADQGIYSLFVDDTRFNDPRDHALDVCRAMAERNLRERVRWYAVCTPQGLDNELAEAMVAAGCQGIALYVDSADAEHLQRMKHTHTPDDILTAIEACRHHGIVVIAEVQIGGPGESRRSIERTIGLMKSAGPDMVNIHYGLRVYPNTPLGDAVQTVTPLRNNFHLRGAIYNNESLLRPVFYIESLLGRGVEEFIEGLIDHDPRYLFAFRKDVDKTYNYNDPTILTEAILHEGHRGAQWDIWRRLIYKLPPLSLNGDRPTRGKRRPRRVAQAAGIGVGV
jgi:radical SAM superfamily enzyme YgiQ (UPF0313 family)